MAEPTQNWPELAGGLFDQLTGRGAEITYEFERFSVSVPSSTGDDARQATWQVDGILKIRTRDDQHG